MRLVHIYILIVFLLFSCISLIAQEHDYIQYTTKDGLPTNYVYGVVEDDEGYIWAYTENGMAKFDGYTFKNFSAEDGLPGNDIPYAVKDKWGSIWLDIYRNKPATYILHDSIIQASNTPNQNMSISDGIVSYMTPQNSELFFEKDTIITYWHRLVNKSFVQNFSEHLTLDSITTLSNTNLEKLLLSNKKQTQILISNDTIYHFHFTKPFLSKSFGSQKAIKIFGPSPKKISIANKYLPFPFKFTITYFHLYKLNKLPKYILRFNAERLILLDEEQELFKNIDLKQQGIINGTQVDITMLDSSFLVSTTYGYLEYDFDAKLKDRLFPVSLSEQYTLLRSFKDSKGNVWIGSREGGLFLIPAQRRKSQLLSSDFLTDRTFEKVIGLENGDILGFTDNSGVYLLKDNQLKRLFKPDKRLRFRSATSFPYGILMSSSHKNYVINEDYGIIDYTERFRTSDLEQSDPTKKFMNSFSTVYDEDNKILYGGNVYSFYQNTIIDSDSINTEWYHNEVRALYLHPISKELYIGNDQGLYFWQNKELIPVLDTIHQLKNISVLYGTSTHLWIGTESNGVFTYNFKTHQIYQVSNASYIRSIKPYKNNTLLIASNEGVLVVDSLKELRRYTIEDGLLTNEIQDAYYDGERYIYVVNSESLLKLDQSIEDSNSISKEDLQYTQVLVNKQSIPLNHNLNLTYDENDLEIHYHLMSFASNGHIQYSTKLEPLEKEWRVDDDRESSYLNLNPGQYTFHLKAEDVYGNEVSLLPITINIRPAYWQTVWFKVSMALFLIGVITAYLFFWKRRQKKQIAQEKVINRKIADLELSALKAQMNPHFVFNALGAIQYYIQTNNADTADDYLTHFAQLIRKYLNSSREKVVTLKEEVDLLKIYTALEKMRFESLFDVELKVEKDLALEDLHLPSMLIQPFVENAINHGLNERRDGKGFLSINFYVENAILYCIVEDNGIGRIKASNKQRKGHHSKGMTIIEERVNTLRNSGIADISILIEDIKGAEVEYPGTRVTIVIRNLEE